MREMIGRHIHKFKARIWVIAMSAACFFAGLAVAITLHDMLVGLRVLLTDVDPAPYVHPSVTGSFAFAAALWAMRYVVLEWRDAWRECWADDDKDEAVCGHVFYRACWSPASGELYTVTNWCHLPAGHEGECPDAPLPAGTTR